MKTIEFYLLLILFFNVFSQNEKISDINLDSSKSDLDTTISDSPLSNADSSTVSDAGTNTNTDSSSTISDSLLSNADSISPASDAGTNANIDSSSTISDSLLSNADSISTVSDAGTNSNTDSLSTISETNAPNSDSSSIISETNAPNADLSTMNLDTTLSTTNSSDGNSTQTDPIISIKPRIILLGFSSFQRPIRSLVLFNVYFKRILANIASRFLHFTVVTNYLRRLRVLEEQTANCSLISNEANDMVYNCSVPVDENRDFTMSAKDDFVFSDLETDLVVSSYANSTMKSLSSQTDDIFKNGVLVLTDSTLTNNNKTFIIEGNLMEGELNDKQVTLSLDENGNGNLVNISCDVNDQGNKKYQLVCSSNKKIKAHLEGVMGKTSSDKLLLIHMADANNDLVDLDSSSVSRIYQKKSSNGLSNGAIAGIIIGCCVALIAALVAAFLCSRKAKPPIEQTSTLEINSSNAIKNNFY
jgi:hypothetical protein